MTRRRDIAAVASAGGSASTSRSCQPKLLPKTHARVREIAEHNRVLTDRLVETL